ncbi:DUF4367 domain-containing protein [Paenibacillus tengchongensis]|uniref:DUF4367 domain-containing protein n=1 Tax=Paenibacillus tengchongensis TaxID=2608684 RepID=UPI00124D9D64|nr:DUF4367 domain-containing protein [Paenibacillus tengchongensis]
MRNVQRMDQEQGLRAMDLLPEEAAKLQSFDITGKVMEQINRKSGRAGNRRTEATGTRMRMRKGFAVPAMALACVLGLSVTGYAASQYLEFRDSKGAVVMNTAPVPEASEAFQNYTDLWFNYFEQAKDLLRPGEYGAYYVKDDIINQYDQENPVKFAYQEAKFTDISGLQTEIKRTGAPVLTIPAALPDGFHYDYGFVGPDKDYSGYLKNAEYRALAEELIQQAETDSAGKRVFIRKVEWTHALSTVSKYTNGDDSITISAVRQSPDTTLTTVVQNEQDTGEKLNINGSEVFYIRSGEGSEAASKKTNHLGWQDEANNLFYQIIDNPGSSLTQEDLVEIAASFLAAQ